LNQNIQEDEIDLKELFKVIWKNKKFVAIFTSVVTIASIIFAFTKTPIYEVKALIEIGSYNKTSIDDINKVVQKLNVLFIDIQNNIKDKNAEIESIKIPKESKSLIEIIATGTSNELAIKEIDKVMKYVQTEHKKALEIIINEKKERYNSITKQIANSSQLILNKKQKNLSVVEMLEFLRTNEKIDTMKKEQYNIKSLLAPYNYKNTQIVGDVITNNYPIKPKKILIITVGVITGFILSIFLLFFMASIRSERKL
jgi:LPS O-antigen subunit length determinant protein (WzzB/FepE family)